MDLFNWICSHSFSRLYSYSFCPFNLRFHCGSLWYRLFHLSFVSLFSGVWWWNGTSFLHHILLHVGYIALSSVCICYKWKWIYWDYCNVINHWMQNQMDKMSMSGALISTHFSLTDWSTIVALVWLEAYLMSSLALKRLALYVMVNYVPHQHTSPVPVLFFVSICFFCCKSDFNKPYCKKYI